MNEPESEFFYVSADIWDDPIFPREVFSERLAFLWVKTHVRVKNNPRALAGKWMWTEPKVRTFIRRMLKRGNFVQDGDYIRALWPNERESTP